MKICLVHNAYGKPSGEETVVAGIQRLLEDRGHRVIPFMRSSAELEAMPLGKIRAFCNGIYSSSSKRKMAALLASEKPDVVHVHNVFPFISASVLTACSEAGVPVVMTVHNYRLTCPSGLHMVRGQVCEKCLRGREFNCFTSNCENDRLKSLGYALRSYMARRGRLFLDHVTLYITMTEFQRRRLIGSGFPAERIEVIPNLALGVDAGRVKTAGDYVAHIGRISPEKGVDALVEAARRCPGIPFRSSGSCQRMPHLARSAPQNFQFLGFVDAPTLDGLYRHSRIIALCSTCFEGFPTVLVEAMLYGKPVVCSRIGGLPEIVEHGKTGLLFTPGDAAELAARIQYLWDRPDLCRRMGEAGLAKARREYSTEKYYARLMASFDRAIRIVAEQSAASDRQPIQVSFRSVSPVAESQHSYPEEMITPTSRTTAFAPDVAAKKGLL
jgi:glycosyltransferase involved in cell wall biosynthesis